MKGVPKTRHGELDTLLGKKGPAQGGFSAGETRRTLILLTVVPWLLFSFIALLFLLAYRSVPMILICFVAICLILCMRQSVVNYMRGGPDGAYAMALCVVAIVVGTFVGRWNDRLNLQPYWAVEERRVYENVGPQELADAHRDAAAITFVNGVKPDVQASVGYGVGSVLYCVAPVGSWDAGAGGQKIQFWAAGKDCCTSSGSFSCDNARSSSAHGGLVINTVDMDNYILAVRTAEAVNGVSSVPTPIFLRWVTDFAAARDEYLNKAWLYWFLATLAYLPLSAALVVLAPSSLRSIDIMSGPRPQRNYV